MTQEDILVRREDKRIGEFAALHGGFDYESWDGIDQRVKGKLRCRIYNVVFLDKDKRKLVRKYIETIISEAEFEYWNYRNEKFILTIYQK